MSDAAATWRRLRLKVDPATDDDDWRALQTTPNAVDILVGGTADDGDYTITLTGQIATRHGGMLTISSTVTFDRAAAETSAQVAAELEALLDAATINAGTSITLASLGIVASVNSATITIVFPPHAIVTVTGSAPGTATITFPVGASVPITANAPLYGRAGEGGVNGVTCMLNQMDDAGATLLVPGSGTVSVQIIEICEIETVDSDGHRSYSYRYGGSAVTTLQTFGTPFELPVRGAKYWTLRILTDAGLEAGTDSIEVIYRDSAT
jgi:hypothetical protein